MDRLCGPHASPEVNDKPPAAKAPAPRHPNQPLDNHIPIRARALAQRSAEAAKQIKALILASERRVDQGAVLVGRAGDALQRIVAQVLEIAQMIGDISARAEEQSDALDQINKAIVTMDQVTQSNSTVVEETTAALNNLSKETEELGSLVAKYKVTQGGKGMRDELKRVAPHAFRNPSKAPPRTLPAPAPRSAPAAIASASAARVHRAQEAEEPGWEQF